MEHRILKTKALLSRESLLYVLHVLPYCLYACMFACLFILMSEKVVNFALTLPSTPGIFNKPFVVK